MATRGTRPKVIKNGKQAGYKGQYINVSVSFTPEVLEQLDEEAFRLDLNRSQLLRSIVTKYLD
jgi:hypothetical protein